MHKSMKISLDRLLHIDGIAALTAGISLLWYFYPA